ncbi:MAG: hypothetical protein WC358_01590 [Ignavibacteria bacterium]|jgi:hypothetical protein
MQKLGQNNKKIKFTTLKYLYEIAAIPSDIREKYLQKLLSCPKTGIKRKNSTNQKNVKLLEIINESIRNEDMTKWDENEICMELNISKNMLYCHKHYILKGIREYYFNWKEIEEKEIKRDKNTNEIEYNLNRAILMNEIGLKREAKSIFLNICKILETKKRRNIDDELILLKSYEKLCFYYYHQNNRNKFNIFYSGIEKIGDNLLKRNNLKKNKFLVSEINIALYHCLLKKLGFNIKEQNNFPKMIELCKKIYYEAKRINNQDLICKMLTNISAIYQDLMQFDMALKYNRVGLKIAEKYNMRQENICFCISIALEEYLAGRLNYSECINKMTKLYDSTKFIYLKNNIKERILFQFFCLGTVSESSDFLSDFIEKYYSYNIIVKGYKSAVRMLYYKKFTNYLNKVFLYNYNTIPNSTEKSVTVEETRKDIITKLEDLVTELLSNFNKKHTIYFIIESYLFMLQTEFCKGKNMDFERFNDIYYKIKWILKTRSKIFQGDNELYKLISILKICSQIIEGSRYHNEDELINKYGQYFESSSNQLFVEKKENILPYFTFFSFTAEQSRCKRLRNNSDKLYFRLEEKYPDIFLPIKKRIEENKIN